LWKTLTGIARNSFFTSIPLATSRKAWDFRQNEARPLHMRMDAVWSVEFPTILPAFLISHPALGRHSSSDKSMSK